MVIFYSYVKLPNSKIHVPNHKQSIDPTVLSPAFMIILAVLVTSAMMFGKMILPWHAKTTATQTRRRMAPERRGAGSSLVSMETPYYKTIN